MDTLGRLKRLQPARLTPWIGMAALGALSAFLALRGREKPALSDQREMSAQAFDHAEPGRGRAAVSPARIPPRGWFDIIWRTLLQVPRDRLFVVAGGVTFFSLLALVPAISAFTAIYGLLADVEAVREQIGQLSLFLPGSVVEMVANQMFRLSGTEDATLSAAFAVSLLLALWSSAAGMNALFDGMNIAYGEAERRSWFRRRMLTTGFTAAAIIFFAVLSFILVAVPLYVRTRYGLVPDDFWWVPFRWVLALALVAAALSVLYRYGPCRARARNRWVWLGGVFGSVLWLAGSLAYSALISHWLDFQAAYGSLGAAVGFMVWIWFSTMAVLLGAELNAEVEHQTAVDTTTGPPMPMGRRGAAVADSVGLAFNGINIRRMRRRAEIIWSRLRR